jgi:hypothetical protein
VPERLDAIGTDPETGRRVSVFPGVRDRGETTMNVMFWPGKHLDPAEEGWLRNRIASLQRAEDARAGAWEAARTERLSLERYLPENLDVWTPDQLEAGAHIGPWSDMRAATTSATPGS